jgi:simple sugar transport system substrate-binding protein
MASSKYLTDGSIDKIFFWDPAVVGHAMNKLALILIEGGTIEPGLNLGLKGYENLQPVPGSPHAYYGNGWIIVDASNWEEYPF